MTPGIKHAWLDAVIADRSGLDAVAVAAVLWSHMNRDGICWPSLRLIADEAECSQNTVQDRIRRLEAGGFLKVTRRRRGANTYQAVLPSASPSDADGARRSGAPPARTSASSDAETASFRAASASKSAPSASPSDAEHVNPRRGEHGAPAAPYGGPAGRQQAPREQVNAIHQRVEAIEDRLDKFDEQLWNWADENDDRSEPESSALTTAALSRRLGDAHLYFVVDNEYALRHNLTVAECDEIDGITNAVTRWLDDGGEPPIWLRRTVRLRDRLLNPQGAK
jgi:hypothetical protein